MKKNRYLLWAICLIIGFFLSGCASYKTQMLPVENLPQIGTRQASIIKETPRSKILVDLIKRAEQQIDAKEPDAAFSTLERALGIDAQDPVLWHLMAQVQLMRGNFDQAEQLAKKSNLLAVRNPSLRKKNGDIIARSRKLRDETSN
ncbi:MAG: tetratricopeptide repeat protein [Desulfobacteraceae bacterium]|nr:tetratricopeptide repeat protein [Desulfobacteraceae bacterium]